MSATTASRPSPANASKPIISTGQAIRLACAVAAFLIPWVIHFPGLSVAGHRVFSVFLLAVALWVTDAIPLHATSAIIIFLEILLISNKSVVPLPEDFAAPAFSRFFAALADPVLMLFLGGFFLADGASKYRLDRNLAGVMLRPFGRSPRMILLGLMVITAVFSMFMSNTATTATMMAVVIPVIGQLPSGDRMRAGLALSIPVAANVGGMGTPIGTPPNAIALAALSKVGFHIGFVQWMIMAIPFMVVILFFAWLLMSRYFRSSVETFDIDLSAEFDHSRPAWVFYITAVITIVLWMTEQLHGLSSSVVGFFPVVVLLATEVFTSRDLQNVQWHVLWLVAGGIALGVGVGASGLDRWLIGLIGWDKLSPLMLTGMCCLAPLVMGTFMSRSATANLLVPLGMTLAASDAVSISPVLAGVFIALGASLAMALPISTPPNAIAMSTGAVKTKDMAFVGVSVGLFGLVVIVLLAKTAWSVLGVMPSGGTP